MEYVFAIQMHLNLDVFTHVSQLKQSPGFLLSLPPPWRGHVAFFQKSVPQQKRGNETMKTVTSEIRWTFS